MGRLVGGGVTVGKENPPLIQEGSLFLGILPHWDQVVVQDHLTLFKVASPRTYLMTLASVFVLGCP